MDRKLLLEKLDVVAPALSDNGLIAILSHVWFTGTSVMAYNDQIGISTPLKTDFKGAVPRTIIDLLKASRAKDIDLVVENDVLVVKAASSRFKLGILPPDDFIFKMPKPTDGGAMPGDRAKFFGAIEACMRSVSNDTSTPDQLGVTLIPKNDTLAFYATNNHTLSHAKLKLAKKASLAKRVILSAAFCKQMLRFKSEESCQLELYEDHALFKAGSVTIYGRVIYSSHPLDFDELLRDHLPDSRKSNLVSIPTKLKGILDRACIITGASVDTTSTVVSVKGDRMRFYSKSDRGDVTDTMLIEPGQNEVTVSLDPRMLKAGAEVFDKMLIMNKCAVMCKDDTYYLVSATEQ